MNMVMGYTILHAPSVEGLEKTVIDYLDAGYVPMGDPFSHHNEIHQAMVLIRSPDEIKDLGGVD